MGGGAGAIGMLFWVTGLGRTCGRKFGRGVSLGGGINCGTLMG